jgi:hypothetical protein
MCPYAHGPCGDKVVHGWSSVQYARNGTRGCYPGVLVSCVALVSGSIGVIYFGGNDDGNADI